MKKFVLSILGVIAAVAVIAPGAFAGNDKVEGPNGEHQVVVCKYVSIPGVGERLQTGQNPIVVDSHSLEAQGFTGAFPFDFEDAHVNSKAVRWAADSHDGSLEDCPGQPIGEDEVVAGVNVTEATCTTPASLSFDNEDKVDYVVTGTVAAGETVTVVATAKGEFKLLGDSEFTVTFAAAPTDCGGTPPPPSCVYTGAGKDGQEGNDDCAVVVTPPVTTATPPVVVPPVAVVTPPKPTVKPKPNKPVKAKPKAKPKKKAPVKKAPKPDVPKKAPKTL